MACLLCDFGNLFVRDIPNIKRRVQLRDDLTRRPLCNPKESFKFSVAIALKALGYVAAYANSRPTNLISQPEIPDKTTSGGKSVNHACQLTSFLPCDDLLELLYRGHAINLSNLSNLSNSSNLYHSFYQIVRMPTD